MDEANSVPMMMKVNPGVEEGFASNQPSPMTESAPAIVTSKAQTSASDQLPPLPSQKKRKPVRKPSETAGVRDLLFKLYGLYEAGFVSNPTPSLSSSTTSSSIGSSIVTDSSNSSSFGGDRKKAMREKWKKRQEDKEAVVLSHEIDRYLSDAAEQDIEHFDILNWWRVNGSKYPVLAAIARDVLAIPVSTVASESTFSTGGRTINSFRSSLSPAVVEALICTQNWLKSTSISLQVEPTIEEMEFYEAIESEMRRSNANAPVHIFTD